MQRDRTVLLGVLILAAVLRLYQLGTVPGLHGDEAWFGLQALDILEGLFPLLGMNNYTGPLFSYLVALFFLFDASVFWLRFVPAVLSIATVALVYLLLQKYGKRVALFSSVLFTVLPWQVIMSRIAWEVALFPFFIVLFLYLHQENRLPFVQGLLLGLATYTHLMFIVVPATLIGYLVWKERKACLQKRAILLLLVGMVVGYAPRLFAGMVRGQDEGIGFAFSSFFPRLFSGISVFLSQFNGSVLFQRITGEVVFYVPPLNAILLLLALGWFIGRWRERKTLALEHLLGLFLITSLVFILLFVSQISLRYFVIPNTFATLLLGLGVGRLRKQWTRWVPWLILIVVLVNLPLLWVNYFAAFQASGGKAATFMLGKGEETSAHFMRTDMLYSCLREQPVEKLITKNFFLAKPLEFYQRIDHKEGVEGGKLFIVVYPDEELNPTVYEEYAVTEVCPEAAPIKVVMLE